MGARWAWTARCNSCGHVYSGYSGGAEDCHKCGSPDVVEMLESGSTVTVSCSECLRLREENARLRAALERIVGRLDHADKISRPVDGLAVAMAHDARIALAAAKGESQ